MHEGLSEQLEAQFSHFREMPSKVEAEILAAEWEVRKKIISDASKFYAESTIVMGVSVFCEDYRFKEILKNAPNIGLELNSLSRLSGNQAELSIGLIGEREYIFYLDLLGDQLKYYNDAFDVVAAKVKDKWRATIDPKIAATWEVLEAWKTSIGTSAEIKARKAYFQSFFSLLSLVIEARETKAAKEILSDGYTASSSPDEITIHLNALLKICELISEKRNGHPPPALSLRIGNATAMLVRAAIGNRDSVRDGIVTAKNTLASGVKTRATQKRVEAVFKKIEPYCKLNDNQVVVSSRRWEEAMIDEFEENGYSEPTELSYRNMVSEMFSKKLGQRVTLKKKK